MSGLKARLSRQEPTFAEQSKQNIAHSQAGKERERERHQWLIL